MPRDEAFKECVAIVRLLVNLDTKYKKLRKLAIDDPQLFIKKLVRLQGSYMRQGKGSESL